MEQVKLIPGFKEYTINTRGEVMHNGIPKALLLKKGAAAKLRLRKNNKSYDIGVAKLMATLFLPNPDGYTCVQYIDGNHHNCCLDNIAWVATKGAKKVYGINHAKRRHSIRPAKPPVHPSALPLLRADKRPAANLDLLLTAVPVAGFASYSVTPCAAVLKGRHLVQIQKGKNGRAARVKLQTKEGEWKRITVAKLVAAAFVPNPEGHTEVIFKDKNKQNCKADNLQWVSRADYLRYYRSNADSYELLGPPKTKKIQEPVWIDPERVAVEGFPDYYISPKGILYKGNKIVKPSLKKGKSPKAKLRLPEWPRGQYKWWGMASLVATYFIPNPRHYKHVIFKDRDNQNCTAENIAWVDGETFVFYSGMNRPEVQKRRIVLDRYEAAAVCTDFNLKKYYETLDEVWLEQCWAEVEKAMRDFINWKHYRSETYLYFIDRVKRFSITGNAVGLLRVHMKATRKKLQQEISDYLPVGKLMQTDESMRTLKHADDSRSMHRLNWG